MHGAFPAHAGIDREKRGSMIEVWCLPRARGDRPVILPEAVNTAVPSPRTRGSTVDNLDGLTAIAAFPAHAGIDL